MLALKTLDIFETSLVSIHNQWAKCSQSLFFRAVIVNFLTSWK